MVGSFVFGPSQLGIGFFLHLFRWIHQESMVDIPWSSSTSFRLRSIDIRLSFFEDVVLRIALQPLLLKQPFKHLSKACCFRCPGNNAKKPPGQLARLRRAISTCSPWKGSCVQCWKGLPTYRTLVGKSDHCKCLGDQGLLYINMYITYIFIYIYMYSIYTVYI